MIILLTSLFIASLQAKYIPFKTPTTDDLEEFRDPKQEHVVDASMQGQDQSSKTTTMEEFEELSDPFGVFRPPGGNNCLRPTGNGCRQKYDQYVSVDCDGDGFTDHACWNANAQKLYAVLSTQGCQNEWTLRPRSQCPKAFSDEVCLRPTGDGCRQKFDRYMHVDCDGDGIEDHVCLNTRDQRAYMVLSSEGCPNSWGLRSRSLCPQAFNGKVCARPQNNGCTRRYDQYLYIDCDGDGIKDHYCKDTSDPYKIWLVLSSEKCPNSWGSSNRHFSQCRSG